MEIYGLHYEGAHFTRLVEHVASYPARRRKSLARLYGARGDRAEEIAVTWCEDPARVRRVAMERLSTDRGRAVLKDLAFDHDIVIPIDWVDNSVKKALDTLGFIRPLGTGGLTHVENTMPAALAAILSPLFDGVRTTLPLLLGAADVETVRRIAENHGLDPDNHHIPLALSLSEMLSEIEVVEEFAESFETDVEIMGPAMMALELGGLCFWQEVFGYDLEQPGDEDRKVVAFMRPDERHAEKDMAETLLDHGICFRVDGVGEHEMLVVPEELWMPLWELGRRWLMEWTAGSWAVTAEQGVRRGKPSPADAHVVLKCLICEADAGELPASPDAVDAGILDRWSGYEAGDPDLWSRAHRLGWELGFWTDDDGRARFNPTAESLIDEPRVSFVRTILHEWVTGYVGAWSDARLAQAIGLDEVWRTELIRRLVERGDFAPVWMHFEGLQPQQTGSGCLRTASAEDPEDLLIFEMGLANGLVWTEKLMWLDLLSLLESGCWYPIGHLVGLMQLAASVSVFGQLLHVLESPQAGYYIPVQRASFLVDPHHEDALMAWVSDVVDAVLEPLGVAIRDGDSVWLESQSLRIATPPGLTDDGRQRFVQDIFADPEIDFRVPSADGPALRPVPSGMDEGVVDLSLPIAEIRDAVDGKSILDFDGKVLRVERS